MSGSTTDATDEASDTVELAEEDRHSLLRAERRRITLDVLSDRELPVDLRELAARVAAREGDGPDGDAVAEDESLRRVAITLHHNHLPKAADMGVLDYDPGSRRVESCRVEPLFL